MERSPGVPPRLGKVNNNALLGLINLSPLPVAHLEDWGQFINPHQIQILSWGVLTEGSAAPTFINRRKGCRRASISESNAARAAGRRG